MKTIPYTALALVSVVVLISACTSGHDSHGGSDDHHSSAESDSGHGHEDEGHHESDIGKPGDAASVDRKVSVSMDDTMRFTPSSFEVVAGETIQFDIVNAGKIAHEFVLGSADELKEHHALMQKFPGMEHDEPNSVSLETSASGQVIWTFTKAGTVDIACLKPGHFEAGMKGAVTVVSK